MQMVLDYPASTGEERLSLIRDRAAEKTGLPAAFAQECAACCRTRFASWMRRPLTVGEAARLEAYFGAVVRGKVLRSRGVGLADARRRLLVRSLAEDLLQGGVDPERIAEEVSRALPWRSDYDEVESVLATMVLGRAS